MTRLGKHRKLAVALFVIGWLLLITTTVQANMRFYSVVQQFCSKYNIPVSHEQMKLENLDSDAATFQLLIRSLPRNNLEQALAICYIAAGQAIAQTGLGVKIIRVTVVLPNTDRSPILTEATVALVDQMRLGRITPSEFIRALELR